MKKNTENLTESYINISPIRFSSKKTLNEARGKKEQLSRALEEVKEQSSMARMEARMLSIEERALNEAKNKILERIKDFPEDAELINGHIIARVGSRSLDIDIGAGKILVDGAHYVPPANDGPEIIKLVCEYEFNELIERLKNLLSPAAQNSALTAGLERKEK